MKFDTERYINSLLMVFIGVGYYYLFGISILDVIIIVIALALADPVSNKILSIFVNEKEGEQDE